MDSVYQWCIKPRSTDLERERERERAAERKETKYHDLVTSVERAGYNTT